MAVIAGILALGVVAGWFLMRAPAGTPERVNRHAPAAAAAYVGEPACTTCHELQGREWRQSDHAAAMAVASDTTVLGDFDNAVFRYAGVTSTFSRRGGRFLIRTDGPDGQLHDYEVKYVFGVDPLQQYLIEFPGGRLQCLGIAWDTRPEDEGGRRWFHLYPNDRITHTDPLHWTGPNQNWNDMCADCHSTSLRRNYDLATNTYETTWTEINVSCEACHGPGSAHVRWAEARKQRGLTGRDDTGMGLVARGLRAIDYGGFGVGDATSLAARVSDRERQTAEIQACAPCHARRGPIRVVPDAGAAFLDNYRPALLDDGLYYADGQMREEVYEYGSFTQSKMYMAGVTCSDCHNAHSLRQRATGNNVCSHCHLPLTYDAPAHHHHKQGTEAALCANCHMMKTTYMVVDPRRDHSMRVPRPDYTVRFGVPNACTRPCHEDRSVAWAADAVVKWYGPARTGGADYVEALDAGRRGLAGAEPLLQSAVLNTQYPPIARATALTLLRELVPFASVEALQAGLRDPAAIVRSAAARVLDALPEPDRVRFGRPLLTDQVRLVRAWAAAALAGTPAGLMTAADASRLAAAIAEYEALERAIAERPEAHLNLSGHYARLGLLAEAESALATALRLDPGSVPARINLADLYRAAGRDPEGERVLRAAIELAPEAAEPYHALGLLEVRLGRPAEALPMLRKAHELRPQNSRFGYVYAVALDSQGRTPEAVDVLQAVHEVRPADADVLSALASFERKRGRVAEAIAWAEALVRLRPADSAAQSLLSGLRREAAARRHVR
ncbi:MAG: tetratricopeptide repeat protein [Acidobacteriota bacterium]